MFKKWKSYNTTKTLVAYQTEVKFNIHDEVIYAFFSDVYPSTFTQAHHYFITINEAKIALLVHNIDHIDREYVDYCAGRLSTFLQCKYIKDVYNLYSYLYSKPVQRVFPLCRIQPHPLEHIICCKKKEIDVPTVLSKYRMLPPYFVTDVPKYIKKNIYLYSDIPLKPKEIKTVKELSILNKKIIKEYVSQLADKAILDLISGYIFYKSRKHLVKQATLAFSKNKFMIPLPGSTCVYSINKKTPITNESIMNKEQVPMICYGKATSYQTFEIQELIDSLHFAISLSHGGSISTWPKPFSLENTFMKSEIIDLRDLVKSYKEKKDLSIQEQELYKTLYNTISVYISTSETLLEYDKTIIEAFHMLDMADKEAIKHIFLNIFYTGMYMRRWKGPGHPYPFKEKDTRDGDLDIVKVSSMLKEGNRLVKTTLTEQGIVFYKLLYICDYYDTHVIENQVIKGSQPFYVMKDKFCVRIASTKFLYTVHHYMCILYKEPIDHVNAYQIEKIQ